jgi:hypothetical protein
MSPKGRVTTYDSKQHTLAEVLPSRSDRYWFIPETESPHPPVFDLSLDQIAAVLNECPFFEYYIADKANRWVVAESDHDQFHVILA